MFNSPACGSGRRAQGGPLPAALPSWAPEPGAAARCRPRPRPRPDLRSPGVSCTWLSAVWGRPPRTCLRFLPQTPAGRLSTVAVACLGCRDDTAARVARRRQASLLPVWGCWGAGEGPLPRAQGPLLAGLARDSRARGLWAAFGDKGADPIMRLPSHLRHLQTPSHCGLPLKHVCLIFRPHVCEVHLMFC